MNSISNSISEKTRNIAGAYINPSTEEKQASLEDLTQSLYELVARLDFLPSIKGVLADIRVTPTGIVQVGGSLTTAGTVSTVTTVTTLANQTSIGGFLANPQIPAQTNTVVILSNINNITI